MVESLKGGAVARAGDGHWSHASRARDPSADDAALDCIGRRDVIRALQILQQHRTGFGTRSKGGTSPGHYTLEDVAVALPSSTVFVTVLAGARGGAALAIRSGSPLAHTLSLPQLTADAIRALVAGRGGLAGRKGSLAEGYRRFNRRIGRRRMLRDDAWRDWDRTLQGVLAGLGAIGWSRMHRWLRDTLQVPTGSEVVLSLPATLACLPVAAVLEPRSGRYFLDDFAVRRIPDAGWLIRCEQKARVLERLAPALLAVLDPGGDLACDPDWPRKSWDIGCGHCEVLAGASATPAGVTQRLPSCTHYVHFGHGSRHQRHAVLELANEADAAGGRAELHDRQVRALSLTHNRLSILAACESSLLCGRHGSELNGMAGSFLQAGSACVIGCLWPVESSTTRRLVERTLSRHLGDAQGRMGLSPAQALRRAQLELRDSTSASGPQSEGGAVLHLRPFGGGAPVIETVCERHLYYWAAFSCLGG